MTYDLPYTPAYGKIGTLFDRIAKAKVPDSFTVKFLSQSLGLSSTNDRKLIPLLKKLGFVDPSGKPTSDYGKLKNPGMAGVAIAEGIKRAYGPLYEANEATHELSPDELKGLVAQVSGVEEALIKPIVGTLNSLVKLADFSKSSTEKQEGEQAQEKKEQTKGQTGKTSGDEQRDENANRSEFKPEFRFNIEVHLPSNGTEETYLAIFNALRKSLG